MALQLAVIDLQLPFFIKKKRGKEDRENIAASKYATTTVSLIRNYGINQKGRKITAKQFIAAAAAQSGQFYHHHLLLNLPIKNRNWYNIFISIDLKTLLSMIIYINNR